MKRTGIKDLQRPIIISGPCSAETEEQVMQTAKDLHATGKVDMLRAGIWKPRTRPNSFEGIGEKGLDWLVAAGEETGLPVITEVANTKHVERCLKKGFDRLWIGARTTVNPFAVQEIADALKGTRVEVLVKNPINPDLNLWIGAIERFQNVGLDDVHAIHRGFSSVMSRKYRNDPMWEIPIALKRTFPEIKMICDPSHITGKRDLIFDVSQKAMDLIYDGLMIESHPDPDNAWSDAAQQVTPLKLKEILDRLIIRKEFPEGVKVAEDLSDLRLKINDIDYELIRLIAQRMVVAEEIGQYKKEHNITILQPNRWAEIKRLQLENAERQGLSSKFVSKFLEAIHQESIRHQTAIMNKG
ncbi:MAG: bifunctional 3-deoxy-7-phosphoheptulonate synthase/chorismate mutase type II [Crocinitomicaceae bacterium]|nr:bifunctional 3-deoxy-7-phosphoheptulonate synthase/chorismate mutase type II [Crocinitomicaceae bacterium]